MVFLSLILSLLVTIACMVLFFFAASRKTRLLLAAGIAAGIGGTIFSFNSFVSRAVKPFAELPATIEKSIAARGASYNHMADSVNSEQLAALKKMEPEMYAGRVPSQFYHYLGFSDYYRLPIVYPYSFHCNLDSLHGDLYLEEKVSQFDVNDNGEEACGLIGVTSFTFNSGFILGKRGQTLMVYDLLKKEKSEFESEAELTAKFPRLGLSPHKMKGCMEYYRLLR